MIESHSMNPIQQIHPREAYEHITKGALLVDVRERDEFEYEKCDVESILNIPMSQFQTLAQTLPKDKELITVCQSGGRSFVATQLLQAFGFENVSNLVGGISSWKNEGLPVK
ncbi:MAG: hypothetical protein RLY49_204 [Candidatus Parcubacteria bacterium]